MKIRRERVFSGPLSITWWRFRLNNPDVLIIKGTKWKYEITLWNMKRSGA